MQLNIAGAANFPTAQHRALRAARIRSAQRCACRPPDRHAISCRGPFPRFVQCRAKTARRRGPRFRPSTEALRIQSESSQLTHLVRERRSLRFHEGLDVVRKSDRPERLAVAAMRLFAERGYAVVAIRDVAAAADLPAGAVFYHYPRKVDLAVAAAVMQDDGIRAAFAEILAAKDGNQASVERLVATLSSETTGLARGGFGIARLAMELASEGEDAAGARTACLHALESIEDGVRRCLLCDGIDPRAASSSAARFSMAWLGASVMTMAKDAGWWKGIALPEVTSILRETAGTPVVEHLPSHAAVNDAHGTSDGPGQGSEQTKHRTRRSQSAMGQKSRRPSADTKPKAGPGAPRGRAMPAEVLVAIGRILDEAGKPIQRRELLTRIEELLLAERGLGMPGRDPYENLLTIVSKDAARTYINLTPHGIWIRGRPYAPLGYAPGAGWKRGQAPAPP